jgi:nucleoside-diphosphate-sugar epimerase
MPTVFYIGATGYLGGAVLADLVGAFPDLDVTALVRNPQHFNAYKSIGVKVIQGSFGDIDIITSNARAADITLNMGDSDDVPLTEAILAGQAARVAEDHKAPAALLHTSGVAVFAVSPNDGKHDPNAKVWNDGDEADIRLINDKMLHGGIDEKILRASEKGHTVSYIVAPGAIVGPSTGPVPTATIFFRFIVDVSLAFKKAVYVGEGANVFYMVCLDDLVRFYRLLFAHILSGKYANASPYSRYYVAAKNPVEWKHIATLVGATLKRTGKLEDGKPQSISASTLQSPVDVYMGATQHVRAERAAALGWEARTVVVEDYVEEGVKSSLEKLQK